MRTTLTFVLVAVAALLSACGADDDRPAAGNAAQRLEVAAAFYPLEEAARAIGGDRADVAGLTPPGAGPHDLELEAPQLRALEQADLVAYLGAGFQPAVEDAVRTLDDDVDRVDLLDAVRLRAVDDPVPGVRGEVDGETVLDGKDPHVWVDPARFLRVVDAIRDGFVRADPANAGAFRRNAANRRSSAAIFRR